MAISARQAQLQNQRSSYSAFTGTRRVLAPTSTGISTIAKQNAKAELETMVNRYNDGMVSNDAMKTFLQNQLNVPGLSQSEKVDIQDKIGDFDMLVRKDKLEAAFKVAPELSMEKIQAAQALSNFYRDRAATMSPETPAHSQALENMGVWDQRRVDIQQAADKKQRANLRYIAERNINELENGTSDRSFAKSQMYEKLAQEALNDGDVNEYNKYLSYAQQEKTTGDQRAEAEGKKASIANIRQYIADEDLAIAKLTDKTAEELKAKAEKLYGVAQMYADTGDQYNATRYLAMATQAEEKYNKKLASSTGASLATEWDANDDEYRKTVKKLQGDLSTGKINIQQYSAAVANMMVTRKGDLESRVQYVEQLDPNEKLKVNGKNIRAEDLLTKYYTERDTSSGLGYGDKSEDGGIEQKLQDFASGNVVPVVVGPREVTKAGNITLNGSEVATVQFVNKNNLVDPVTGQISGWVPDENGLFHKADFEKIHLTPEQVAALGGSNAFQDENGQFHYLKTDNNGQLYYEGPNKIATIYRPSTAEKIEQPAGETVKSFNRIKVEGAKEQFAKGTEELKNLARDVVNKKADQLAKPKQPGLMEQITAGADALLPKSSIVSPLPQQPRTLGETLKDTAAAVLKNPLETAKQLGQNVGQVIASGGVRAEDVVRPPKIQNTVQTPVNIPQAQQSGGLTYQPQGITYNTPPPPKPVTITQTPQATINTQAQPGLTYMSQPAKAVAPPPPKPIPQPTLGTKIMGAVDTLKKSAPISWLGKKTGWW